MVIVPAVLQAFIFLIFRNRLNACKNGLPISKRLFRCHIHILHFLFSSPAADAVPEAAPPVGRTFVKANEEAKLDHERLAQVR